MLRRQYSSVLIKTPSQSKTTARGAQDRILFSVTLAMLLEVEIRQEVPGHRGDGQT
ncbi:hypothetical protein GCM10010449_35650 [Streptomyces rectiviolaceus]|uniref:Transposase n=1 Tax=Streptomyces rectiviolaceus TaxID=332591 RepID=A0ABP6MFQ2_9ACTN